MTAPSHTLIYTHGGGRLGNQILRFAHWMAWARAHAGQVEVLDLAFWPYADLFATWREHPGCVFPLRPGRADDLARKRAAWPGWLRQLGENRDRLPRLVHAAGNWRPGWQAVAIDLGKGEKLDLADRAFFEHVTRRPVTTCSGWEIASWRLFAQYAAEIRECFRPAPEHARRAEAFMAPLRAQHDVVAGLLIRQTDYRVWAGGAFFFPSSAYVTWVRQLLGLHSGRRVAVVVAAEEPQDPAQFAGLPCHFAGDHRGESGGHWFDKWVQLSMCDFIVSAPSTFSATAAFAGAVPLWPVVAANQQLAFDQLLPDGIIGAARHPVFSCAVK